MSAIDNLHTTLTTTASNGPFALDAAFLTSALADPDIKLPDDYDNDLSAAFQVGNASQFIITVNPENIGAVNDSSFTVNNVSIPFFGSQLQGNADVVFTVSNDEQLLIVQIATSPAEWTWTDSFSFMGGFPFDQLHLSSVEFIFSSASGQYPWGDSQGKKVVSGAKQNFSSLIPLPTLVEPLLVLFDGLGEPSGNLQLSGIFDLQDYSNPQVLFPAVSLDAVLNTAAFDMLYLKVSQPRVNLTIPAPKNPQGSSVADFIQTPSLSVAADIQIGQGVSPYILKVDVTAPSSISTENNGPFSIGLEAKDDATPLTPATIINLVGGGDSYFSSTPPVLQQFLALVGLQGLSLAGNLGTPSNVSSIAVRIGSSKDTHWTPIPNAPAGLDFTITEFYLDWTLLNPFNGDKRQQTFLMGSEFTLAPSVFKGPNGEGDGLFKVQFTSDLEFSAQFDGTATLGDFLSEVTDGAVSLNGDINLDAQLSNIKLSVDFAEKSFSFSSGFEVTLGFLTVGGQPIISITNGQVSIAAKTATQDSAQASAPVLALGSEGSNSPSADTLLAMNDQSKTVWQSSISGLMGVGPLYANVSLAYDGFESPARWNLSASLAQEIQVEEVIQQFFDPNDTYDFPNFLPGDLIIKTFAIDATIPSGTGDLQASYSIDTSFAWNFTFGSQSVEINPAKIGLKYDGSKADGQQFSGMAEGTWNYDAINLTLLMGYQFMPSKEGTNQILFVEWEGFRAEYQSGENQIVFSLKGWSLGTLIQALVRTLGNPYYVLPSPWDLLNQVSLDGMRVNVSLESGQSFSQRLSASYELSTPIDLGFINIKGIKFFRTTEGKVNLALDAEIPSVLLDSVPAEDKTKLENLTNTSEGQDTDDLPSVPGRGQEYFKLFLLVLGQRVGITGSPSFESTQQVICALADVPNTTGKTNPVNPNANQGNPPKGLPYYDQGSNWLIAAHLGLLKVANAWTIDAMLVFNDPNLYGMRLALAGPKAGGLSGLSVDILYKKITDDVGVFQIEFTFPDAIRNLNFGAVSITLPEIGIKIYTNGDFFIDIGFPYDLDFRRSFSIAAIVYGVPVLGSGGFYFGKLSNDTATQLPVTNKGTFDPVITFGLGLQLGLGYNFTKGPLSAGFALTVFGIVEGVFAPWHPYDRSDQNLALRSQRINPENGLMLTAAADSPLQGDNYFKLSGTVGVIGLLYGTVDFAIIQASLNVKITLSLQITYESYKSIPLIATATVDVSLKVKISLGFFSISLSFSFSANVSAKFVIGEDGVAPWDDNQAQIEGFLVRNKNLLGFGPVAARMRAQQLQPQQKRIIGLANEQKPTLNLLVSPPSTVLAPEGATEYTQQQGAFALLMAMDAPDASSGNNSHDSSFDQLCHAFFPWVIDALENSEGETVNLSEIAGLNVNRLQLESYIERLADLDEPPLDITGLLGFLQSAFMLNITTPEQISGTEAEHNIQSGSVLFPVFDGLSITVPNQSGSGDADSIQFETYATATSGYRKTVAALFSEVQAAIESENEQNSRQLALTDDAQSMASIIFVDSFLMIARQLLQAALDLLDSYAYELKQDNTDCIQTIISDINGAGNNIDVNDVVLPNKNHAMSGGIIISINGLTYSIQGNDTLDAIATKYSDPSDTAKRWITTAQQIIVNNPIARVIQANVQLVLKDKDNNDVNYTTSAGDNFQHIAEYLGIDVEALSNQSVLYDKQMLSATTELSVPDIAYTTATAPQGEPSTDTFNSVAEFFGTTVSLLAETNQTIAGVFSPLAENGVITLANLAAQNVSNLWTAIQSTDQVAQTAGMVSRFLMYGLRLPNTTGLALSDEFLYPDTQNQFGLYQLTGQQFPTPLNVEKYEIGISRADQSHGIDLDFILFNETVSKSMTIDLTEAYQLLSPVLDYAKEGHFLPSPSFTVEPLATREAKEFAANLYSQWSTSDIAYLQHLTNRSDAQSDTESGVQAQATLWPLPASLLNMVEARQASILGQIPELEHALPLLPNFQPQIGNTSPSSHVTEYRDIKNWAWTTRVDFQVKRIPAATKKSNPGIQGESVPKGVATAVSLDNVYEVVGPNSSDALKLEQLLTVMDELGEDVVSSVSLLYQQGDGTTSQLITLGQSEFLAFITQTNLSTETNPERSALLSLTDDDNVPTGIANSPGEFVKLLWELSVVRSGGYYLFYQVIDGGDGLPASVFDASATATLSMVVTYNTNSNAQSPGNALLNCMNSFVTTDTIDATQDILRLSSLSAGGESASLKGNETLAWLSKTYGPGPGRIAEVNASDKTLTSGIVIPIAGIIRQLDQADVANPEDTLSNLANYYSVGAQEPITATEIQNLNPGVTVELGAVFYIPAIEYVVTAAVEQGQSPGNTFSSMAAYYGLSVDAVAVSALNVVGIFPQHTQITINSQLFDLRSTLGPGNIGMLLERANLGEPDSQDMSTYPEKYLYQMYNTLSAGLDENVFFNASPMGLPFGPQAESQVPQDALSGSHAEIQAHRRLRLQSIAEQDYEYKQALGFGQFAKINAAPENPAQGLPPSSNNPYIGIGTTAQIALRWQDILGNTTITPFDKQPSGYSGAINGEAITIRYMDRLIAMASWPNVQASYIYTSDDTPQLVLSLNLDTSNYTEVNDQVKKDLQLFEKIYFQLHQDYTNLGVPGVTGNAVSMSISNSLFKTPNTPLTEENADKVRQFIVECVQFLSQLVAGATQTTQPSQSINMPVIMSDIKSENIIELDVDLIFTRQALLTDPTVAALNDGLSVSSGLLPQADNKETIAYTDFAAGFESVFTTDQWQMKVGEGLRKTDQGQSNRDQQLWATRFGKEPGQGIYFDIGDSASYYAPKPVAKSLQSKKVEITDYKTGQQAELNFTAADLNLWFQTSLNAVDTFLAADYSSSAFILDKILGTQDPLKDGYLGKVLSSKQYLADAIASTVKPVLSNSATDASSLYAASEKFRQQLLNQLGSAYQAGTVTVFDLSNVSGAPIGSPVGPPNLYGQPAGEVSTDAKNQNYTLTPAKIPLGQVSDEDGQEYEPKLAFVLTSKNISKGLGESEGQSGDAYVPLDLNYQITHLEFDRTEVKGITGGYVQSRWMQFVLGPYDYKLGNESSNIPIVNRALPTPPSVQKQVAAYDPDTTEITDLVKWDYGYEYEYQYAPGDAVQSSIELNYRVEDNAQLSNQILFNMAVENSGALDDLIISDTIFEQFKSQNQALTDKARVRSVKSSHCWKILDNNKRYHIEKIGDQLRVSVDDPDLFAALAQFVSAYPDILEDFNQYLRKIDAETPDENTIEQATKAVSTFEQYINNIAEDYALSINADESLLKSTVPEMVRITFEIILDSTAEGYARTDIIGLQIDGIDATWSPATDSQSNGTISNGIITLPAPAVEINNKEYKTVVVNPPPAGVILAYTYQLRSDESQYLSYQEALAQQKRTVVLPNIDVLAYQNAWSEIFVQRNKILFPIEDITRISTTPYFIYTTPVVKFSDPIVPQLNYEQFPLSNNPDTVAALESALNEFFKALFTGGTGSTTADITLSGNYSYLIASDLPRISLPINMLPPTEVIVNPEVTPSFNKAIADTINLWYEKQQPTQQGTPQINFNLHVFGGAQSKQPLLVIKNLYFVVEN